MNDTSAIVDAAEAQRALDVRRESLIQHPETGAFLRGALVEAAFQRERWSQQDAAKDDADWFWTLSYIVGKALRPDADDEHRLHHVEAAAALLANWHRAIKARLGTTVVASTSWGDVQRSPAGPAVEVDL